MHLLAILAAAVLGAAQPEGWDVTPPAGGERTEAAMGEAYLVPGQGVVAFFPPEALSGRSLEAYADAFVGGTNDAPPDVLASEPMGADGWLVLVLAVSASPRHMSYLFREADGLVATSLAISETDGPAGVLTVAQMRSSFGGTAVIGGGARAEAPDEPAAAPAIPSASGGPSGLYTRYGETVRMGPGGYAMLTRTAKMARFTPDGWLAIERSGEGFPDCEAEADTTLCRRYEARGGAVRIEKARGAWSDNGWKPLGDAASFKYGSDRYVALGTLTGMRLDARYVGRSSVWAGGGPGSGGMAVGVGSVTYVFFPDGRFARGRSSAMSVMTGGAPPAGSGGSSSRGTDGGTYAFEANTLVLALDGGGTERLLAGADEDGWSRGDAAPDFLSIGGRLFAQE